MVNSMTLKRLAFRYLPNNMLRIARSLHYRSSIKHYDIDAEPDLYACQSILKPGDTVIDVGANIGVYTRFCAEFVGPSGRVISLEPVPETYSYLVGNVRALKLKNVECLNVAASDHDNDADRMTIPQYSTGGANLYEAKLSPDGNVPVKVARLDTLFADLTPAFIKCDVEGHEIACINGALNLIRRCQPKWMVEISTNETFELFRSLNYVAFSHEEKRFCPYDSARPATNYFFFPALSSEPGSTAPMEGGFGRATP
jgi:FkbM family methyltransferase